MNENLGNTYKKPYILAQSGVPSGIAPSGTIATNGQVTLGTALLRTYSNGIWFYLPAGAVVGGLAGLYWCVMSSTTAGQVYTKFTDTSSGFVPYIPTGTLVNAVGSNAAYTQTTGADLALCSVVVPANAMGLNGCLRIKSIHVNIANANTKVARHLLGGLSFDSIGSASTSNQMVINNTIFNTGIASSQISQSWGMSGTSTAGVATGNIDTSLQQSLVFSSQLSVATDYLILEAQTTEILPS
jgi:hypothetical protein